ncbi:uncharacterized protein CMC5_044290 [Chondromyces crocatus]|uniref:Uncharacterized protein n=1 Tax=Chondromyces crocatus TaxID=52 RepID=A0A0K1EHC6_CHOCO|nr:uncharacterized protein CMC5_044290 [Chondromyces crocatus]
MRKRVNQLLKFMGVGLAVVFLGPGVELAPSQDSQN